MTDDPTTTTTPAAEPAAESAAPLGAAPRRRRAAEPDLIALRHPHTGDWTLSIGATDYPVTAGVVQVAPHHYDAAHAAGFRPE